MSTSFYETVYSSTSGDDYWDCSNEDGPEYLGIALSDRHGTYIPQIFCQNAANEQAWKDAHVIQLARKDKDNPNLIHYEYIDATTTIQVDNPNLSLIQRHINAWRRYLKFGYYSLAVYENKIDVKVPILEHYNPWEICKLGDSYTVDIIDTSLSPFQRLLHNWRSYLHYGTWEEECTVEKTIYNESYWDAWDDVMNNWHYFLKDGRKVVLYQDGDLWEVTYDRKDESDLIIAEDD